ncbi:MAG: hypothetical protein AAF517_20515 [Planctomycetota bacterium]
MIDLSHPEVEPLRDAAQPASFEPAPADGVLPRGFYATTNLPTWVLVGTEWRQPARPRMDGVVVLDGDDLFITEGRNVRAGQPIVVGLAEDGSEGVLVPETVIARQESTGFQFQSTSVSRERHIDYDAVAAKLVEERDSGGIVWVLGPAVVHSRAREDFVWFIENGFVHHVFAGNALAAHDIEMSLFGSALGVNDRGESVPDGHAKHLRAINEVRAAGSIAALIENGDLSGGIMHALESKQIPYVLAGSIRDDGPLPEVETDCVKAQGRMRDVTANQASMVLVVATQLHGIAAGNMLPTMTSAGGTTRPLTTVCVDQTEFAVNKLHDRGSHQAFGVVTNAQDFVRSLKQSVAEIAG